MKTKSHAPWLIISEHNSQSLYSGPIHNTKWHHQINLLSHTLLVVVLGTNLHVELILSTVKNYYGLWVCNVNESISISDK